MAVPTNRYRVPHFHAIEQEGDGGAAMFHSKRWFTISTKIGFCGGFSINVRYFVHTDETK